MEIILLFSAIIILALFLFILIEQPYYLVSIFVFLNLYDFNIELPIPLDLRGLISIVLFLRLIIFDKENLTLVRESLTNKFIILILIFTLYSSLTDYFTGNSLLKIIRLNILNLVALFLGFITIYRGYAIKTLAFGIILAGVFSTGDLIYSYYIKGVLIIKKIADIIIGNHQTYNHNFFGAICGHALITVFLAIIARKANKLALYFLLAILLLGIIVSTSRMTFISTLLTFIIIVFTQPSIRLNFRKILMFGLVSIVILGTVGMSYSFILKSMNIKSEFAEQIEYRLIEEPLSIFDEDVQKYGWDDNKVQGTMRWRYFKILNDADKIFKQNLSKVLFGFGTGGYTNIGQIQYKYDESSYQYSAHNFYINTLAEKGLIGITLFFIFFISITYVSIKLILRGLISFSFVYLFVYQFVYTFGGDPDLTGKFSFLLYGALIADIIRIDKSDLDTENEAHQEA